MTPELAQDIARRVADGMSEVALQDAGVFAVWFRFVGVHQVVYATTDKKMAHRKLRELRADIAREVESVLLEKGKP